MQKFIIIQLLITFIFGLKVLEHKCGHDKFKEISKYESIPLDPVEEYSDILPKKETDIRYKYSNAKCGIVPIPQIDRTQGRNSDLHLYVSYTVESSNNALANANWCQFINRLGPTHGTQGELKVLFLRTPNVLQFARNYYGCQNLHGMLLEDQGGKKSAGSHWEQTAIADEYMNASISLTQAYFSGFTTNLLRDTGFYAEIDESMEEQMFYGKGKGCDFIYGICELKKQRILQSCERRWTM
ncbi:leishmanolysin family protein, putative [Ichthyophthirius multifiliis]|uniref:Leishmanolysin family protein, putative n=1 Tax=Ichthyophthirius multifiliis TaxID=5932 RepID=G0R6L8_ICHMU|nr:leishmanolysin family protein, putative [Ichthyophthirius multifiliis]EGR26882.1 leishmanolysin family protein, putative [Ichthyophthirius multifiliis]|eukprot:XP_004023766.1 leishmanolysin family protein, putative [Ichthyophthirius multifiliis]